MEQSEPDAIGRCAVDGETVRARLAFVAARFDAHAFMPRDSMAHSRLRVGWRDNGAFAKILSSVEQCIQSGGVNAIVIGDQKFQWKSI